MQGLRIDPDAVQDREHPTSPEVCSMIQHLYANVAGGLLHRPLGTTIDQTTQRT